MQSKILMLTLVFLWVYPKISCAVGEDVSEITRTNSSSNTTRVLPGDSNCSVTRNYVPGLSREKIQLQADVVTVGDLNWNVTSGQVLDHHEVRLGNGGLLWNSKPVTATNWQVELQFKVHEDKDEHHGAELTFYYRREKPGEELGNIQHGLQISLLFAVEEPRAINESTTNSNANTNTTGATPGNVEHHPRISVMVNGTGRVYEKKEKNDGRCWENLRESAHGNATWLRIRYQRHHLTVSSKMDAPGNPGESPWALCVRDTREDLNLPTGHHIGFGLSYPNIPAPGSNKSSVDILQVKTYELELPRGTSRECEDHEDDEDDDHHHPEIALETLAAGGLQDEVGKKKRSRGFPWIVLAVPFIGMIIVSAFCVMAVKERARASGATLPSWYTDRRRSSSFYDF